MKLFDTFYLFIFCCIFNSFSVQAQCNKDRHSTNLTDGWMSCEVSPNPIDNQMNHWIQYDFGSTYALHNLEIWNINHPDYLHEGIRDAEICISQNGTNWTTLGVFTIPRADAKSLYLGTYIADFEGASARYLLITAINNHGGGCIGFSEIKIGTSPETITAFALNFSPCENAGLHKNLSGGLSFGGTYSGQGVTDNGDETFDFDPDFTGPGNTIIYYSYNTGGATTNLQTVLTVLPCGDSKCPECINCDEVNQTILNSNNIPSGIYHKKLLESYGTVQNNQDVIFRGNDGIELTGGFEVTGASGFKAEIRTCYENVIVNGGFEQDLTNWYLFTADSVTATANSSTIEFFEGTKSAHISVTESHPSAWRVQFHQDDIIVEQGKTYRLSFSAKGDGGLGFNLNIELDGSPWTSYIQEFIPTKSHWENHAFTFTVVDPAPFDVRWSAHLAAFEGEYYFDQIKFAEITNP